MSFLIDKGNSTKKHWDDFWSKEYPKVAHLVPEYQWKLVESVLKLLDVQDKNLLEVGCGSAGNSAFFASQGAHVFVLDFSRQALQLAGRQAASKAARLFFIEGTASNLPFRDNSLDCIYHSGFLEHFHDPASILREQIRILKPGGFLLVDVPQKYTIYTLKKQCAMRRGRWYAGWETQFSPRELEDLIRGIGLEVVDMYPRGMALSYGWFARKLFHGCRKLVTGSAAGPDPGSAAACAAAAPARRGAWGRIPLYFTDCIGIIGRKR